MIALLRQGGLGCRGSCRGDLESIDLASFFVILLIGASIGEVNHLGGPSPGVPWLIIIWFILHLKQARIGIFGLLRPLLLFLALRRSLLRALVDGVDSISDCSFPMLTIGWLLVLEFVIIFSISDIILAYQPMLLASDPLEHIRLASEATESYQLSVAV